MNWNRFLAFMKVILIIGSFVGSAVVTGFGFQLNFYPLTFGGLAFMLVMFLVILDEYR